MIKRLFLTFAVTAVLACVNNPAHAQAGGCSELSDTINSSVNAYDQKTGQMLDKIFHYGDPLGVRGCVESLMQIGGNLGTTTYNPMTALKRLGSKLCGVGKQYKRDFLTRLNQTVPTDLANGTSVSITDRGGFREYETDKTAQAVNSLWDKL